MNQKCCKRVFITSSSKFTSNAINSAEKVPKNIVLIDGVDLHDELPLVCNFTVSYI
ncbi:restriction endonuclease [Shimazuella alba]|uniref:restriction endonuclease n=1 Tax=Shimazuella alba TaxID=2690964 RepID=UPI003B82E474